LCGCIPRNLRVRAGKLESSQPELQLLCSAGREMRGDEKKKDVAGKLCACVSAHLDFKLWRRLFSLFYVILASNPDRSSWRSCDRSMKYIRSECFRNGYLYNGAYIAAKHMRIEPVTLCWLQMNMEIVKNWFCQ